MEDGRHLLGDVLEGLHLVHQVRVHRHQRALRCEVVVVVEIVVFRVVVAVVVMVVVVESVAAGGRGC